MVNVLDYENCSPGFDSRPLICQLFPHSLVFSLESAISLGVFLVAVGFYDAL